MLTSQAREGLRGVETVILDEVHAVAGTKRGAHLALSLERLDALLERPAQRIGLSATVSPMATVASFVRSSQPATIVAPPSEKLWDLQIRVPVDDMADVGAETELSGSAAGAVARTSIWPHIDEQLVDLIEEHRTTLVFANSRRLSERITAQVNEIAAERALAQGREPVIVARAHHGSVSKEQRAIIVDELRSGRRPAGVAKSALVRCATCPSPSPQGCHECAPTACKRTRPSHGPAEVRNLRKQPAPSLKACHPLGATPSTAHNGR